MSETSPLLSFPVTLGLSLHALEAFVVVRELLHVRERDLAGDDRVVAGHVGLRIVTAVLELDIHPHPELLEVEAAPVDSDRVAHAPCLLGCRPPGLSHVSTSL